MSLSPRQSTWQRNELLHLLSLAGTLAGLCITGVALFHTLGMVAVPKTDAGRHMEWQRQAADHFSDQSQSVLVC